MTTKTKDNAPNANQNGLVEHTGQFRIGLVTLSVVDAGSMLRLTKGDLIKDVPEGSLEGLLVEEYFVDKTK